MNPRYDSILFDFDGVLADTEPVHWRCWAQILRPEGIELDWATYARHCIGVADRDMLAFLGSRARVPVGAETLWPHYGRKKALFRAETKESSPCLPETVELVRSLTGYAIAVVTSSGRDEVEPLLERAGLRAYLGAAVYGEDVARLKPSPDPYLLAAERLDAKCPLVVEDSSAGVESARAAGFDVVRVASAAEVPAAVRARLRQ